MSEGERPRIGEDELLPYPSPLHYECDDIRVATELLSGNPDVPTLKGYIRIARRCFLLRVTQRLVLALDKKLQEQERKAPADL